MYDLLAIRGAVFDELQTHFASDDSLRVLSSDDAQLTVGTNDGTQWTVTCRLKNQPVPEGIQYTVRLLLETADTTKTVTIYDQTTVEDDDIRATVRAQIEDVFSEICRSID